MSNTTTTAAADDEKAAATDKGWKAYQEATRAYIDWARSDSGLTIEEVAREFNLAEDEAAKMLRMEGRGPYTSVPTVNYAVFKEDYFPDYYEG